MKDIKVNVSLGNKDALKSEIEGLGKNTEIKIDLTETNKSLRDLINTIASLNSKLNDIDFSKLTGLGNSAKGATKDVKETANVLERMSGKETKVTITTNSKGAKTEVTEFGEAFAKTSKQIEVNGKIMKQSTTTNFKKAEDTFADFSKRIKELGNSGADVTKLTQEFNRLKALNTDAPEREIKELGTAIGELEKKFETLNNFKFKQNLKINENLFTGKIDITQAEQLKNTLNSISIDNLNKGMATFESQMKMAVASTSDMKLEMNAFKKNEAILLSFTQRLSDLYDKGVNIDKLETQFNKLNTLKTDASEQEIKDLDKAIKELETNFKKINDFKFAQNSKINEALFSGKIDISQAEQLKNTLNSINVDNLAKGMSNFNTEFSRAKSTTSEVKSQISTLEGSIVKMSNSLKSAQDLASKTGNNSILNSTEYINVNSQLQVTEQLLEQIKSTGKTISLEELNKSVNNANNAVSKLNSTTTQTASGFKAVQNALATMQTKLDLMKNTKILDEAVLSRLQSQLNSLSNCTDKNSYAFRNYMFEFQKAQDAQRQIKQLEQALARLKEVQFQALNSNKINTTHYTNAKKSIKEVEDALNRVRTTGETINMDSVMARAKTSTDNLKNSLTGVTTATTNFGTALQNSFSRLGIYISVAMMVRKLWNELKEGINYVKELDRAFFDISATMDITNAGFEQAKTQVQEMAKEMGISATAIMDVVKTYANASTTMEEVMAKSKPSVMLSNITGQGTSEVTKNLNSALNAFKMIEQAQGDASKASERYGDVLVKVSQNMNYDFADGVKQLQDAIKESGNVAEQAGMSYEEYASVIGAMVEATGKTGSELANGTKMIVARTYSMKELGEELGMTTAELNKGANALRKFGIEVVNTDGSLKPFGDILRDLKPQWDTMTEAERNWLAESVAGNRQRAIFISMMDTMNKSLVGQNNLYEQASNSMGTMVEVQGKYMDSIEGKMGKLTATAQTFWDSLINSNIIKGGVGALTGLLEAMQTASDVFGGTTLAVLGFTALFSPLIMKIVALIQAEGALATAQGILNAVMNANPILLLVGALASLVVGIGFVIDKYKDASERAEEATEANNKFRDSLESLSQSKVDLESWAQIQRQLENSNLSLEERNNLIDQSDTLESQLGSAISGSDGILQNSLLTWQEKKALIEQCIEMQKKANAEELNGELESQKKMEKRNAKLKEYIENYQAMAEEWEKAIKIDPNGYEADQLNVMKESIIELYQEIQNYNGIMDESGAYLDDYGRKSIKVSDDVMEFVNSLLGIEEGSDGAQEGLENMEDGLNEVSEEASEAKKHLDTMCDGVSDWNVDGVINEVDQGLQAIIDDAEGVADAIEQLTKQFEGYGDGIELANQAIDEFNEYGYLTGETWDKIISSNNMDLLAGLWLEAGEAKEYYKNLSEGWQEERENTANTEIMLSALEKGLIEENSQAYQIAKQAEIDASNASKQQRIADLETLKNEEIRQQEELISRRYNNAILGAKSIAEAQDLELQKAQEIADKRHEIESKYSSEIIGIQQEETQGVIAEYERQKQSVQDKTDFSKTKYNEEEAEFQKTTDANKTKEDDFVSHSKTNMESYKNTATANFNSVQTAFSSTVSNMKRDASSLQSSLSAVAGAIKDVNSKTVSPTFSSGANKLLAGAGRPRRSSIDENEFTPVAPMSLEGSSETVSPMSADGGSSSSGEGEGGTAPIQPYAIPGGVQHGASSASGSTVGSTSGKIQQLAGSVDKLASSVKNLTSATKSSNSETEKEIKNIEIELDRYYKYNDVLEDYENILKEIKDAKENANKSVYLNLQKQELALYGKKIEVLRQLEAEQQRELNESKNILMSNGFLIDSYGNLINSQERLQDLVNQANNSSNDVKEANQDHVKYLEEIVDLYTKLANDSIPDTIDKIRDLQNEINDTAIDHLTDLRKKLVDAIKEERELQKQSEIDILDSRIEELKRQIEELEDDDADLYSKKARLEAEIAKWQKDDSGMGIKKVKELQEQLDELNKDIRKEELNKQIEEIETTKDSISDTYDKMLEDKEIYEEANRLITDKNQTEILRLLQTYEDDYTDIGRLWGSSLSQAFMDEINVAFEALDYLKGENNKFTSGTTTNTPVTTSPPKVNPTPAPAPTAPANSGSGNVGKGSRVKITDPNAGIYVDSTTGRNSGTWKGAGIGTGDTLYVVNVSGNRMALARTQNINDAIGWIDKTKLMAFATGGYTGEFNGGRLAMLHEKEYVLNSAQTQAWLKLVPMLTELVKTPFLDMAKIFEGLTNSTVDNSSEVTITNNIEINNSSNVDMDKTNKGIEQLFKEQLRKYGKIKK